MRTLVLTQNITVDGSIEMLRNWFDPEKQGDVDQGDLLERAGKNIVVTGSITLCHTLITASLVDEYRLFVYPTVQGRGRRLFPDGFELPKLTLLDSRRFRSAITYSRYGRA